MAAISNKHLKLAGTGKTDAAARMIHGFVASEIEIPISITRPAFFLLEPAESTGHCQGRRIR
jgi:hypothetical protein